MASPFFTDLLTQQNPDVDAAGFVTLSSGDRVPWTNLTPSLTGPMIVMPTTSTYSVTVTEGLGVHDAPTGARVRVATIAETTGLAPVALGGGATVLSITEGLGLGGTVMPGSIVPASVTESLILSTTLPTPPNARGAIVVEQLGTAGGVVPSLLYNALATARMNVLDPSAYKWIAGGVGVETIGVSDGTRGSSGATIIQSIGLREVGVGNFVVSLSLTSGVGVKETTRISIPVSAVAGVGLGAVVAAVRAVRLIEKLGLTGTFANQAIRAVTVLEKLRLQDTLSRFLGAIVTERLGTSATPTVVLQTLQLILERVGVAAVVAPRLVFSVTLADSLKLTDAQIVQMLWSGKATEGIEFDIGYFGVGGDTSAWVMNTRTGATTEYQNFSFNSFARVGNDYYGANDQGIFQLSGADDAGIDIEATIRGGFLQFGGTKLSRLKEAYVAMRAPNGAIVLKIITADGAEYTYQVDTRSMRNTKVHMGKGMRARYFAYELSTVGQDFDLDSLEFVPLVMQRRV